LSQLTPNDLITATTFYMQGVSNYTLKTFSGVGHTISQGMMTDGLSFIKSQLPHDEQYILKPKDPKDMSVKELKQAVRDYGLGNSTYTVLYVHY